MNNVYDEFKKEVDKEVAKNFVKISTQTELYNLVANCLISDKHIMVIANHNGFFDLARANVVMEKMFELAKQEIQENVEVVIDKSHSDPMVLSRYLGNKDNNLEEKPFIKYVYTHDCESPMIPDHICVLDYAGKFIDETDKTLFTDSKGRKCVCINAVDLFPIYLEIINEKEGNNNMKKNNKEAKREIILIDTEFLDNELEAGNETIEVDEIRKIAEDHMPDGSGVLIKEAYSNKEVEELVKMINNDVDDEPIAPTPTNTTMLPEIDRIYYNKTKKTVNIYWANGTETKAVTTEGDTFSLTAGIKECFIKYACGNSFDNVQARLQDAKKKAVLTASKEKKNKKSKVERLVAEAASLTSDEKDELIIALEKVINTENPKKEETVLTIEPGKLDDVSLENKAKKPRSKKGSK